MKLLTLKFSAFELHVMNSFINMKGCSSNNINRNLIQYPKNVDSYRQLENWDAFTTLFNLFLSLTDEPICFSSKTFRVVPCEQSLLRSS